MLHALVAAFGLLDLTVLLHAPVAAVGLLGVTVTRLALVAAARFVTSSRIVVQQTDMLSFDFRSCIAPRSAL